MLSSETLSVTRLRSLQDRLRESIRDCGSVESAASHLVKLFADEFSGLVALARVFATIPFGRLPVFNRNAVATLAASKGGGLLGPDTPVLSLLATTGLLPEWCDRKRSRGHVGIPLMSREFVDSAPMVAALLSELRFTVDGHAPGKHDSIAERLIGGEPAGTLYVADAKTAVDSRKRKVIAAQDFVAAYGIESVFAVGGCWPNRDLVACIVFLRCSLDRSVVRRIAPLLSVFRAGTTPLAMHGRYFSDDF
jgi:hypothetical protein